MKPIRILIGCEESQEITKAFRALGPRFEAYSCDLKPCSGGHPEWHIQGDVIQALNDGHWDLFIVHPTCTHLSASGALHFAEKRKDGRQRNAIEFFLKMWNAPVRFLCIENPVGIMSGKRSYLNEHYPDLYEKAKNLPVPQTIQPYEFGHDASKRTCLWFIGKLPCLKKDPAKYVPPRMVDGKPRWANQTDSGQNRLGPSPGRAAVRARTYTGWAEAMAEQWGCLMTGNPEETYKEE